MNNREAFEAAYRSSSISIDDSYFKLDDNGDYMAISTYNAWAGYQLGCQAYHHRHNSKTILAT